MIPCTTIIYLKIGKKKYILPVNPEEIEIDHPTDNDTYRVLSLGEIMVPNKPGLQKVTFGAYFPAETDLQEQEGGKTPKAYVHAIKQAQIKKKVCRLIITRAGLYNTNILCLVTSFKTTDKGGEPGDIYYEIELTEYRNYSPEIIKVKKKKFKSKDKAESKNKATKTKQREVEAGQLRVGAEVIVNGKYWYSSYGEKPYGTAENLSTKITRIITTPGRECPVLVGSYGWVKESQIKVVN